MSVMIVFPTVCLPAVGTSSFQAEPVGQVDSKGGKQCGQPVEGRIMYSLPSIHCRCIRHMTLAAGLCNSHFTCYFDTLYY